MSLDVFLNTDCCPTCKKSEELYHANITHNLVRMAETAGVYNVLWHPEDNEIEFAGQLIIYLHFAIQSMEVDPERFQSLNHKSGWGTYNDFMSFLVILLSYCKKFPKARYSVSR